MSDMRTYYTSDEKELIDTLSEDVALSPEYMDTEEEELNNVTVKKSNIRNGPASIEAFEERFREFRSWLLYTHRFLSQVEDQPVGQTMWADQYTAAVERHARKITELLQAMLDSHDSTDRLKPINNLRVDLRYTHRLDASIPRPLNEALPENVDKLDDEYFPHLREFGMRLRALVKLLEDASEKGVDGSLYGILEHIAEGDGPLAGDDKRRAKQNLIEHPSKNLERCPRNCGHIGLVKTATGHDEGFILTRRGLVVYSVFQKIRESDMVYAPTEEEELGKVAGVIETVFDGLVKGNDDFVKAGELPAFDEKVELPDEEDYVADFDEVRDLAKPIEERSGVFGSEELVERYTEGDEDADIIGLEVEDEPPIPESQRRKMRADIEDVEWGNTDDETDE